MKDDTHALNISLGVNKTPEAEVHESVPLPGEIVCKFQRPINSAGGFTDILVYDENRGIYFTTPSSPEIEIIMGPDDIKAYAVCELRRGFPVPVRRVKAQNW